MNVFEMIEAQQKGREWTPAFMVGEQLKAICRAEPDSAELVAKDLEIKTMSLEAAAGKIKARADELHKKLKGSCVCVPPDVAEGIIRNFYGLPEGRIAGGMSQIEDDSDAVDQIPDMDDVFLNLEDFL